MQGVDGQTDLTSVPIAFRSSVALSNRSSTYMFFDQLVRDCFKILPKVAQTSSHHYTVCFIMLYFSYTVHCFFVSNCFAVFFKRQWYLLAYFHFVDTYDRCMWLYHAVLHPFYKQPWSFPAKIFFLSELRFILRQSLFNSVLLIGVRWFRHKISKWHFYITNKLPFSEILWDLSTNSISRRQLLRCFNYWLKVFLDVKDLEQDSYFS